MSAMLPFDTATPRVLVEHRQVRTLAQLQHALADLVSKAKDAKHDGPINLADFDPTVGVNVSLNDDGAGLLFIKFRRT